jgi:hypothetical protein
MSAQADKPFSYSIPLCHRRGAALLPSLFDMSRKTSPRECHSVQAAHNALIAQGLALTSAGDTVSLV